MISKEAWENVKTRMLGYWEREAMDRCSASIIVSYQNPSGNQAYYDAQAADRRARSILTKQAYFGEAFGCYFPYFGTAGIAEYTGCKANHTPATTWFEPWLETPDATQITYRCPEVFERQKQAIREILTLSGGDYMVSVTDNCGILDALAAIRGTQNMLMDLRMAPEFVEDATKRLLAIYKQTQEELFSLVRENNDGCVQQWMQLWAPKRLAQLQCDMSVMLSAKMYGRFVVPVLEELTQFLDYSVYHLDGIEQIRHLDHLLSVKRLNAIQWTNVAGQPRLTEYVPVLQKIQKAGKNLVIAPKASEVEYLLDNLSCRGLHLLLGDLDSAEEAQDMLKLLQKRSVDRVL